MADIDAEKKNDNKPEKTIKSTKKLNTSDVKKNPVRKAKDTLNTLSDLPNVDIEDLINNLLKNTQDSVINSSDWKDVYRALSSDDKNSDINDVIKHISSLDFITSSSHMERLNKYKDFKMILSRVPVIKKILRLYTTNILAPDDISKMSVKMIPKNPTISKTTEEYISIENKFKVIIDRIDLEKRLYDLVFQTLFYGDMFVEILSSKRYLMQTLYNLQIPINDKNIKLNESALDEFYSDEEIVDMGFEDGRAKTSYTVKMEWAKPIFQQISETIDFANMYYHSILNEIGINEHNLEKYRNNGFLQYITETFFGDQKIFVRNIKLVVFGIRLLNKFQILRDQSVLNIRQHQISNPRILLCHDLIQILRPKLRPSDNGRHTAKRNSIFRHRHSLQIFERVQDIIPLFKLLCCHRYGMIRILRQKPENLFDIFRSQLRLPASLVTNPGCIYHPYFPVSAAKNHQISLYTGIVKQSGG